MHSGNVAHEVCLLSQSFMSGLFRKKGRDKKLLSRRDIVFGECVLACRRILAAGPSVRRPAVGLLLTQGFTLFSADLEGKSGDRMDLLEASPAVRKSFSGNASRQADHERGYSDMITMCNVGCDLICCRECASLM